MGEQVCHKLGISTAELNALFAAGPVDGFEGGQVADALCARFGLDPQGRLGLQLWDAGILTEEECRWIEDT